MKVSVIIPTFNRGAQIASTLNALLRQTIREFELVVVVDGSKDNTLEVLESFKNKFHSLKVINQENKGRAGSRNRGVKDSSGDLLIFFDDDMEPDENVLQKHLNFHLKKNGDVLVGGQFEKIEGKNKDFQNFKAYLSRKWLKPLGSKLTKLSDPFITAAHFSILKEVFLQAKGFDERLSDAEDKEFGDRIYKKGLSVYFNPEIVAWHNDRVTCEKYIQRSKQYREASKKLYEMFPTRFPELKSFKEPSLLTKAKFLPFSFPFWVRLIDAGFFIFLPKKVRYKLYDFVITSQGYVFNKQIG